MKILDIDSPLMQGLNKMADLMWLNVLTVICCLPVVTVGASLTALNYMALKIARDEECYITKGFFKSFKENFKQATAIWLIFLAVIIVLVVDFRIMWAPGAEVNVIIQTLIGVSAIFCLLAFMFVFPLLAKFDNPVLKTIKNAFLISALQFPKTILMVILYAIPVFLFIYVYLAIPLSLMFGLSVPAWLSAKMYSKFFKKLEDQILEKAGLNEEEDEGEPQEDERIFKDEIDPVLANRKNDRDPS